LSYRSQILEEMTMRFTLVAAAVPFVLALPLTGQQPGNPGPGTPPRPGHEWRREAGKGHREMAFAPEHLLARNGELQLTAQQITALTGIRDAARKAGQAAMDNAKKHMDELEVALDANVPDTTAIRTHFTAAHESMGQAHLARIIAGARAKAVLTDAQRTQVAQWHERHGPDRWGQHGDHDHGPDHDGPMHEPGR
jgi:Spy/CpxP family protein refolding chaperone